MVDTHCHIYQEYYEDIPKLIDEIKAAGIDMIIVNGCDMKSNLEVIELVKKYDIVYGALGFHPTELEDNTDECMKWLEEHICLDKIVAIGEIGLDYHYDNYNKNKQIDVFKRQLDIASKYNKPVIVHSRDAIQDTYDIMSKYKLRGSIHAFSGSLEMALKFIKLGYKIGIGGVVTFKNSKKLQDIVERLDLKDILLETDSPYLSPEPLRGKKNVPYNTYYVAKKIAEIKNISVDEVLSVTGENAIELFDLKIQI